jgi:hypothetical protein
MGRLRWALLTERGLEGSGVLLPFWTAELFRRRWQVPGNRRSPPSGALPRSHDRPWREIVPLT